MPRRCASKSWTTEGYARNRGSFTDLPVDRRGPVTQVLRSYTISSSPIHDEYVEITPLSAWKIGCVSVFPPMSRPSQALQWTQAGRMEGFYFDKTLHRSIVLIAAGSGITPMISMLRYVDDLKLTTQVRLLYCVRSATKHHLSKQTLARLAASLPQF